MYKVLHIDNSNFIRKIFQKLITENGASYTGVSTYEAAWDELRNNDYSMIVTATEISDGKAVGFIEEINKSEFESVPIIVLTSADSLAIKEKLFGLGIVNYILKKNLKSETIREYFYAVTHSDPLQTRLQEMSIAIIDPTGNTNRIIRRICKLNQISNTKFFYSAQEFLDEKENFSIILYDTTTITNNLGSLQIIKNTYKSSALVAITEIDHYTTLPNLLKEGADDFIVKPFNMNMFVNRLKAVIKLMNLK
ncbi:MAG: response regulator [Spirochaetales bacterium]|nr:response regulator [Spirochaetales bacterium]